MSIIAIKSVVLVENGPIWSKMNTLKQNNMKSSRSKFLIKMVILGLNSKMNKKIKIRIPEFLSYHF